MTITVISQTTAERRQETIDLFEKCQPYLDKGYNYRQALQETGKVSRRSGGYYTQAWFRELIEYGETQGYPYYKHKGKKMKGKILERTTQEVDQETQELFQKCKPYLDQGIGFYKTLQIVLDLPTTTGIGSRSWYHRFRDYALTQGYRPLRGKNR